MEEKKFKKLVNDLTSFTDEQRAEYLKALGIGSKPARNGIRVTGKVTRTDKKREGKMAKQMEVLIDCLPMGRAIDVSEWGALALAAGLQTQQPASRIAAYYKKPIVDAGYAKIE